jgi:hypothetical protein
VREPCGAPTKRGTACRNWTAAGESRCSDHGGAAPRAEARRRRKVELAVSVMLALAGFRG